MKKVPGNAHTIDLQQTREAADNRRIIDEWQDTDNRFAFLCSRLHQTLDLNTMLDIFAEELNQVVPCAGRNWDHCDWPGASASGMTN